MSNRRGARPQIKSHANPRKAKRMWVFGNRISRIDTRVTRPYSSLSQIQKADPWTHGDMLPSKRTVKKALNAEKGAFCMSRKNKFSSELKKKVVRMCLLKRAGNLLLSLCTLSHSQQHQPLALYTIAETGDFITNKKSERTFKKKYVRICVVWCTIGDSNPGPTD